MITMTPAMPPAVPSDAAILGAMALLSAIGSPANTQAIDTMAAHKRELDQAISANSAALREVTEAQAALADLQERERVLIERQQAVSNAQTQLQVASSANVARATALDAREKEVAQREQEFAAKVKANEDRIASVRASLA